MTDNTGPACAGARLAWPADSADRTEPLTRMREAATAAAVDVDMLSDDIRALYQFATRRAGMWLLGCGDTGGPHRG